MRIGSFFLGGHVIYVLAFGLSFLGNVQKIKADTSVLRVLTSFYPIYVTALNVADGVEGVEVENLTAAHMGCLHDYQMSAGDARKIAKADVFLVNGVGMEPFLDAVERQGAGGRIVRVSEGISTIGDNAHVWLGFNGERKQVRNIAAALAKASPENATVFEANAQRYLEKIDALEERSEVILRPFVGVPLVVFHGAFVYLARDFGLDVVGVFESEEGSHPIAKEVVAATRLVRDRHVKAMFAEDGEANQMGGIVSRETGVPLFALNPLVSGPSKPEEARTAWLDAMEKNVSVLARALR